MEEQNEADLLLAHKKQSVEKLRVKRS